MDRDRVASCRELGTSQKWNGGPVYTKTGTDFIFFVLPDPARKGRQGKAPGQSQRRRTTIQDAVKNGMTYEYHWTCISKNTNYV
jgi:hypothetical protein